MPELLKQIRLFEAQYGRINFTIAELTDFIETQYRRPRVVLGGGNTGQWSTEGFVANGLVGLRRIGKLSSCRSRKEVMLWSLAE